jgi:hypothetical protein
VEEQDAQEHEKHAPHEEQCDHEETGEPVRHARGVAGGESPAAAARQRARRAGGPLEQLRAVTFGLTAKKQELRARGEWLKMRREAHVTLTFMAQQRNKLEMVGHRGWLATPQPQLQVPLVRYCLL